MSKLTRSSSSAIRLFTIGSNETTAQAFFERLQRAGVKRVVDVRLNNTSQLAGFSKREHIEYFLRAIAGIDYRHCVDLAPTSDLLALVKKTGMKPDAYEREFNLILNERKPEKHYQPGEFDQACLLCSEPTPEKCHRRFVVEHLRRKWGNVEIEHL